MLKMLCLRVLGCLLFSSFSLALGIPRGWSTKSPTVQVKNGSYYGIHNAAYDQDFFLGMPYTQPPIGDLRFRVPQSLNTSWKGLRNATEYSPECIGYGSDQWVLGNYISEDCLTLNVIRPAGISCDAALPVAAWIHGGGYTEGGSSDPRYNLSFIVQQSVEMGTPIIGVSFNYRLSLWGFMYGQEIVDEGATNLALRDQRLALHWIHENIAAFGGDPSKVTIFGESAGANSVGTQLIAYGGRDDKLFRGAISESGGPPGLSKYQTAAEWQPNYDAVVKAANCSEASDTLACLRKVPTDALSSIFNSSVTANATSRPVVDGDFILAQGSIEIEQGNFVKVPYLIGTNFDEGTAFGTYGINTTEEFIAMVMEDGLSQAQAEKIAELYPDDPAQGIPSTLEGRPSGALAATLGYQFKRSAAYGGDRTMQVGRRMTSQMWAKYGVSSYSYHFDVLVHGVPYYVGATHFQEVAFVFDNTAGNGYHNAVAEDPFEDEPATFDQLAKMMSRMWVSFVVHQDPNKAGYASKVNWPEYALERPQNIVFDVNVTNLVYLENDTFRREGMAYIQELFPDVYGF